MATMTKSPAALRVYINGWRPWSEGLFEDFFNVLKSNNSEYCGCYRFSVSQNGAVVTAVGLAVTFGVEAAGSVSCKIFDADPTYNSVLPISTKTYSVNSAGAYTFSFSGLSIDTGELYFLFEPNADSVSVTVSDASATITYTLPTLTVGVTPSALGIGEDVLLNFGNRLDQRLTVKFKYSATVLSERTFNANSALVTCPASWFETAGVTGNSMRVDIAVTDELGRSASANFTLSRPALALTVSPASLPIGGNVTLDFQNRLGEALTVSFQYGDTYLSGLTVTSDSAVVPCPISWYAAAGYPGNSMRINVTAVDTLGRSASGNFTLTVPALSFTLAPSSVYVGNTVALDFTNRLSQTLTVEFKYNDTLLHTETVTADSAAVTCPASWFETAAVSGSSMRVSVSASDPLRRSATGSFTLIEPQGSAATPIAPRSTRLDGTQAINFSWQTADTWGAQARADLQWSTDNAEWTDLATVSGDGTLWTAPAVCFPAGTIYWRVRAVNEYGVVGSWSNGVSFTIYYDASSQVVPADTQTSGVINRAIEQMFTVALVSSGVVYTPFTVSSATLYWRSGTSGAYTSVAMTPDGGRASASIPAGTFPSGTIQWYAEATDNTGSTTLTDTYTLSTLSAAVEAVPLSPINTVESGSGIIVFRWSYASVDDTPQDKALIQTSADGSTWSTLAQVSGADARSYAAAANTFSAGIVYWRIRAKASGGDYGPWSSIVSFVCRSAPIIQGAMADNAPWVTISWQTEGQVAYEIEIDGATYGPYFGANVRSFSPPEPLKDGLHTAKIRAQNQYGLWSEWINLGILTQNSVTAQNISLAAQVDADAALTWSGGSSVDPPRITLQPVDVKGTSGVACFAVDAEGAGITYKWYIQLNGASGWSPLYSLYSPAKVATIPAMYTYDRCHVMCIASNAAGETASNAAQYTYAAQTADPVITLQPETVVKNSGTVRFVCGGTGSAFQWWHKEVVMEGRENDLSVREVSGSGSWHIPQGSGSAGDILATDGTDTWYLQSGSGSSNAIVAVDGDGNEWHIPRGAGGAAVWSIMTGETSPYLSFAANKGRDGEQFFCRVGTIDGWADTDIVQYIYGPEPVPESPGNYYVYRDDILIARTADPAYTDRTALGTHTYRVLNRLANDNYEHSNEVTVTITADTLMIAPLNGGEWLRLNLSDKSDREFSFDRTRAVSYVHYSGAAFPEAEIGEEEELTGSFDAAWLRTEIESAKAFMALLGTAVVVKTPGDVVLVGVLEGYRRRDPTFYLAYTFTVRQMDWRELDA